MSREFHELSLIAYAVIKIKFVLFRAGYDFFIKVSMNTTFCTGDHNSERFPSVSLLKNIINRYYKLISYN